MCVVDVKSYGYIARIQWAMGEESNGGLTMYSLKNEITNSQSCRRKCTEHGSKAHEYGLTCWWEHYSHDGMDVEHE